GTGLVVRPDGIVMTAFHVVQAAKTITAKCAGQAVVPATIEVAASTNDLAILKTALSGRSYLSLSQARSLRIGDPVFTVGFPVAAISEEEPKFTDGSVSALSDPEGEATMIQMPVPGHPGHSGGALLNDEGEVVGIVTSIATIVSLLPVTGTSPQNTSRAVKSEFAKPLFDQPVGQPGSGGRRGAVER